ncbi:DMT family transporter [Defluviimonas sp. WL0024]|uniref:DMT family transporter n=1 Tax=Albidovulum salinarum TaxID=2984153 RepID=A0ABT2X408_9RHOB|nr:DMT family transporter [Defluviimonas sp. WL0024]MCU9848685.1 DMT family transporter [Defluviimonas sp. WL0024]
MKNLHGILLVLFSMAAFSVEDAFIKVLTASLPVGQVLICLGFGGAAVFAALTGPAGWRRIGAALAVRQVALRSLAEAVAAVSFVTALSLVPISTVAAVFQATPLAVTAGAALVFGEAVGWRRWGAVGAGFAGVLMILRPGLEGFRPEAGLVLVTVAAIALRDLVTRRIPAEVPSLAVSFHGFFALVVAGGLLLVLGPAPAAITATAGAQIGAAILCGTAGYYAIVAAMRDADASALMPFRYARLVFSLAIGVAVFAERPDAMTLAGAALILAAAFYTYLRERKVARTAVAA